MAKKVKTIGFWISFFIGVTFAYFIWLLWKKLTDLIGDSWMVLIILAIILTLAWIGGYFSFKQIAKKFT
ncbi:MAG: hypothetical protein KKD01_19550 [Proteobacteria bacterium]|nr:hypothetical protein [Pseudomonadota bacterium]